MNTHKTAEDVANAVDYDENVKLIIAFEKFMDKHRKKNLAMRPYLKIAQYCVMKDNKHTNQDAEIVWKRNKQ